MSQIHRYSNRSLSSKVQKRLKQVVKKASYASRYHEFRLKGKHPLRLLGTPKDPWMGSLAAGSHILSNRFYCEGQILRNPDHETGEWQDDEIWKADIQDKIWLTYLHSFCWLRDLNRSVDRNAARQKAMALTRHWLENFDQWHELSWSPDILGRRIINWMAYAPLILDSNDLVYRSKLLNCLARQARHLYHTGDEQFRGLPRIRAIGGLILAGLYIPYGEAWLKRGTQLLNLALSEEILSDGGVASRNPEDLYRILRDLLMVRASYKAMGHDIPRALDTIIGPLKNTLEGLLMGDGQLALFNGANEQNAQDIASTFAFADRHDIKVSQMTGENSGFRRLFQGHSTIIMDAGPPAECDVSEHCHAGTLSIEFSDGPQRIIVNCGSPHSVPDLGEEELIFLSRSTAAHSTLVLNDKNSSEIRKDGLIGAGPTVVTSHLTSDKGHNLLEASHDGYLSRFGIMHNRSIYMNETGHDIRGEDMLLRKNGKAKLGGANASALEFAVRFHIHPDINITKQGAGDRVLLRLPGSEYWQFHCSGGRLTLEESLYLGDVSRMQNSRQIVISGQANESKTVIKWSLRKIEHNS